MRGTFTVAMIASMQIRWIRGTVTGGPPAGASRVARHASRVARRARRRWLVSSRSRVVVWFRRLGAPSLLRAPRARGDGRPRDLTLHPSEASDRSIDRSIERRGTRLAERIFPTSQYWSYSISMNHATTCSVFHSSRLRARRAPLSASAMSFALCSFASDSYLRARRVDISRRSASGRA